MREILTQRNGIYYKERNKYVFCMWKTTSQAQIEELAEINKYNSELVFEF